MPTGGMISRLPIRGANGQATPYRPNVALFRSRSAARTSTRSTKMRGRRELFLFNSLIRLVHLVSTSG